MNVSMSACASVRVHIMYKYAVAITNLNTCVFFSSNEGDLFHVV